MAHPYSQHAEQKKSRQRVGHIMKSGGVAAKHDDVAADKALFHQMMAQHERAEMKMEGKKAPSRYARGGKVKSPRTNISIVVPQRSSPPVAVGPQAGAAGPPPMAAPAPPMGGPMGPMPPMPMRARGGKVIGGEASAGNLKKWAAHAAKNSYAAGGRLPTAGAETGVGRLQKARAKKR